MNTLTKTNDNGFLTLIIGPMYSGKSSALIDLYKKYKISKINTFVVNYSEDIRYGNNILSSHDQTNIPCVMSLNLKSVITKEVINNNEVFLINEGQFFDDLSEIVLNLVDVHKKIVFVNGLDSDFKRNIFKQITLLIPVADEIIKKKAICKICENGTLGIFTHRLSNDTDIKVIGTDLYIPVCRKCYLNLNSNK